MNICRSQRGYIRPECGEVAFSTQGIIAVSLTSGNRDGQYDYEDLPIGTSSLFDIEPEDLLGL